MKSILHAILFIVLISFFLAACGDDDSNNSNNGNGNPPNADVTGSHPHIHPRSFPVLLLIF